MSAKKYGFRILLETYRGKKFSYIACENQNTASISQSLYNSENFSNFAMSSSQVHRRITGSISCSYQNEFNFSSSTDQFNPDQTLANNDFISIKLAGGNESGSIQFWGAGVTNNNDGEKDWLKRFKFLGSEKVCTTLGVADDMWYFTDEFRLVSGSEKHYFRGDIVADSLTVLKNMTVTNIGRITSDVPFNIDKKSSRFLKFIKASASIAPNNDLLLGYEDKSNQYWLSASNHPDGNNPVTFNIGGVNDLSASNINVNSLNVTHLTSSYVTSSVQQIYTEITSSGNSLFGDANTDTHRFKGNVGIMGGGESSISHSVDGLTVAGEISSSGDLHASGPNGAYITRGSLFFSTAGGAIWYHDGSTYQNLIKNHVTNHTLIGNGTVKTHIDGTNIEFDASVTASGDISSSGDLYVGGLYKTGSNIQHTFQGEISASGDISTENHINLLNNKAIMFTSPAGSTDRVGLMWDSNNDLVLGDSALGGFRVTTNGGIRFYITGSTGNVGIGNIDPPKKLTVAGDISMSGALYGSGGGEGDISASGLVTAKQYQSFQNNFNIDPGTNEYSLPWGSTDENAYIPDEEVTFLAPCNMNIKHVLLRGSAFDQNLSGTPTITWRVKRHTPYGTSVTSEGNWETMETTTTVLDTSADTGAKRLVYAKFSGSHANGGDILGITFQFSADFANGTDEFYATTVAELDYHTLPIVSDSTGSLYTGSGYFGENG